MPEERGISFLPKEARSKKEVKKFGNEARKERVELTAPQEFKSSLPSKKKVSLFSKIKDFFNKQKTSKEVKIKEERVIVDKRDIEKEKYSIPRIEVLPSEEQVEVSFVSLEETVVAKEKKRLLCIILSGVISLLVISGLYFTLRISEVSINQKIIFSDKEIKKIDQEIGDNNLREIEGKTKILESKIKKIKDLLSQHVYWTNFFSLLEKYTLPDIRYKGLSVDTTKDISLETMATTYRTAAQQLLVLQSARDFINRVSLSGIKFVQKKEGGEINFRVSLSFKDGVLKNSFNNGSK